MSGDARLEARVDQLASQLRSALEVKSGFADPPRQATLLARHFRTFDRDGSGAVDFDEFRRAMESLHFVGVQRELEALFDRFDVDLDGAISYQEFANGIFGLGGASLLAGGLQPSAIAAVREKILAAGGKNGVRSLGVILRRMDQNGNGALELEEFRDGIEQLGVRVSDYYRHDERGDLDEIARVFQFFDRDSSGRVTIEELMRGLRGTMSKRRILLVRQAFTRLDTTGDGRATLEEVARLYDASQHPDVLAGRLAPRDALLDMMRVFERHAAGSLDKEQDVEGDGTISWHEFLEYYRELSAGIANDDEFELMVRNAWHLSGGKGWCANSTCRRVLATFADGSQRVLEIQDDLGVGARDTRKMLDKLRAQGHRGIVAIELAH